MDTNNNAAITQPSSWTLNRLIVLVLLGAFVGLLLEIRYTHRHVLGEHSLSWTPLIYTSLMVLLGALGLGLWERGGRRMLLAGFALAFVVGLLGFWLHTMGNPLAGLRRELSAWAMPIETPAKKEPNGKQAQSDEAKHHETLGSTDTAAKKQDTTESDSAEHGNDHAHHATTDQPPVFAPLCFLGLGLLGVLACLPRFQPERASR